MGFFICEKCGESMKKKQVEMHLYKCRPNFVTCIDCHMEFRGNDYNNHFNCITEVEKYGGGKRIHQEAKGEIKQQQWMELLRNTLSQANSTNPRVERLFRQLLTFDNVPCKKAKFINFLKNAMKCHNEFLCNEAWNLIESVKLENKAKEEAEISQVEVDNKKQNGNSTKDEKIKENTKKRKHMEDCDEISNIKRPLIEKHEDNKTTIFKWKVAIKNLLIGSPDNTMKMKKLRKRVTEEYNNTNKNKMSKEEIKDMINKKVQNSKFKIQDDEVMLI